jgi:hypothetical protein
MKSNSSKRRQQIFFLTATVMATVTAMAVAAAVAAGTARARTLSTDAIQSEEAAPARTAPEATSDQEETLARSAADEGAAVHQHVVGRAQPQFSPDESELTLELFAGPPLQFTRTRILSSDRAVTWIGAPPDDPDARLYLTFYQAIAVGEAHLGSRYYRVVGVGDEWTVTEIEVASEECAVSGPEDDNAEPGETPGRVDDGGGEAVTQTPELLPKSDSAELLSNTAHLDIFKQLYPTIDVMIVFTDMVRHRGWSSLSPNDQAHLNAYGYGSIGGGQMVVEAWAENSVAQTNDIFTNSQINARLDLVHTAEVERDENVSDIGTYLDWLYLVANNPQNEVWDLRQAHDADLVQLWVSWTGVGTTHYGTSACGIAKMLKASQYSAYVGSGTGVSILDIDCRLGFTVAHEFGHNLGAAHDRYQSETDDKIPGFFSYSYGYVHEAWHPTGPHRRTVMAYRTYCEDNGFECPRIPYFSNPDVNLLGIKTGSAGLADNARTINRTGWYVSRHRPTPSTPLPPPTP